MRRKLLDLLAGGPRRTGDLAASFPKLSRYAVMQHLGVLARANLVLVRYQGRERWNYLNAAPIHEIYSRWVNRLSDRMAASAFTLKTEVERSSQMSKKLAEDVRTFELELEFPIEAPIKDVWKTMLEQSSRWWQEAKFFSRKNAVGFHIEPMAGGRLWEELPNGGSVLWWTIADIDPPTVLTLVGPMGSAMELAMEQVRIQLCPVGNKKCLLKLRDHFLGRIGDPKKHTATFTEGWNELFGALKRICEA